ncbi:MAG: PTS sugar transporter subunit IIA [Candidatus Hydrogenedentes bacterium]|nr:PTS sugar transporter subunit IIA [Candidatus Hydrogenedentota bacterium]
MKLSSLISAPHIVIGLDAQSLAEAIPELLGRAGNFKPAEPTEAIAAAVLRREAQGSTAMERGVALPHARIPGLRDFYILVGTCGRPLRDKGLDGAPVDLIVLILANDQKNTLMLQSMAALGRLAIESDVLDQVRRASTSDAAWQAIHGAGIEVRKTLQARDLMRECPVVARSETTLGELLDLLFQHEARQAPVCGAEGNVVGAVTSEEILEAGFPDYMARIPDIGFLPEFEAFEQFFQREGTMLVRDVFNKNPLVVDADDPLIRVVFRMRQERQRFAYVQERGRFVGAIDRDHIISRILRA